MNIEMTINAIEDLHKEMEKQNKIEKLQTYSTIQTLFSELNDYAESMNDEGAPIPNVEMYIAEMITPLRCIAGLEDTDHDLSQNTVWVLTGIQKLRSVHCFNIK